jgi:phosphoserine phosphatase RsbU/P
MKFTIKNDGSERQIELNEGQHIIGRHQSASLRLEAREVSGQHARLRIEGGRLFITELDSTNGTMIEDRILKAEAGEVEIYPGSTVSCGGVLIQREAVEENPVSDTTRDLQIYQASYNPEEGFSPTARQRIADMLSSLFELIALDESSESLADKTCEFLSQWLPSDRVILLEDSGEGTSVEPAGYWLRDNSISEELQLSHTLVQRVIDERTSVLLADVQNMSQDISQSMVAMHLRSAMAVPLFDNERVRGILYLDTTRPAESYNADQLQMVTATANAVAIKLRNQSMASEIATAARIQQAILPDKLMDVEGYDLLVRLDMCRAVGGDLYHVLPRPDGAIMVALGDVAGKGTPASLAMSACMVLLSTLADIGGSLDQVMGMMHTKLYENLTAEQFITLFLGDLEPQTGRLSYVNAGHEMPLIIRPDGTMEELEPCSPPVGMLPEFTCRVGVTTLEPGDLLVIFSDGIPEATLDGEAFLGIEPVKSILTQMRRQPLADISNAIGEAVDQFLKGGHASDDVTLLLVRRK